MKRWVLVITTILATLSAVPLLVSTTQAADETTTGRIVAHYTKMETMEVGDVPGHVLGIAQKTGLVFISTGETATFIGTFHADLIKGKGPFVDYSLPPIGAGILGSSRRRAQPTRWATGISSSSKERLNASVARENMRDIREPAPSKENGSAN